MKSQLNLKKAIITVLFVIISAAVFAQAGKISGKVSDKKTGETLIGVTVKVKGTTKGMATDVDGNYIITGLNSGKHTVIFQYIGYTGKEISEVEVTSGKATVLNVILEESNSQNLNEVVIQGSFKKESVNALYALQKNSSAISDGISAEIIKKSPDRNTGEVLKRVSGASIQDNKFVVVRGLNDRYNTALLNNSPLPSTEPDRKAFSFDVIPSNLIDNIVINKTATPDLPGDFAGGAVQIKTKDFPAQRTFEINLSTGYNSISTFADFYGEKRQGLELLGIGSSSRDLPSSFPSRNTFQNSSLGKRVGYSRLFENNWGISNLGKALPTQNLQLIFGDSYQLRNESRLGLIVSATYSNAATISKEIRNDFDARDNSTGSSVMLFGYNDEYYNNRTSVDALANLSYTKGNNKISLKNILKQSFENRFLRRAGVVYDLGSVRQVSQFEVTEKFMLNSVLEGDHIISQKNKAKLNWNLAYTTMSNDQPDLRSMIYSKSIDDINNNNVPYEAAVPNVATPSSSGRFYGDLNDDIYSAALNYTLPFNWLKNSQTFKVGLVKQYKKRVMTARTLGYVDNSQGMDLTQPIDQIFAPKNIGADKFYIDDTTAPSNQYDASGDLNGGYLMMNNILLDKLKATYGVRIENYIERLDALDNSRNAINIDNNYLDILPSVNLTYELTEKANLRMSYSNSVARAQFRELAPFTFYDFKLQTVTMGNPDLKRTQINNFDLRYEFYPVAGQMISVSGFYKKFKNSIESGYGSGSSPSNKSLTYINAPKANLYGMELEFRQNLSLFNNESAFLKTLTLSGNAALMKSEVSLDITPNTIINNNRPMQGQSPYIINTSLQYASANSGWQASVLYNRIGRRIAIVGFGEYINGNYHALYPEIYEAPRDILDFQISKKIIKSKGELKLNVSNILDSDAKSYQDVNNDKYYTPNDQLINSIKYGRTFSLSFGYKF